MTQIQRIVADKKYRTLITQIEQIVADKNNLIRVDQLDQRQPCSIKVVRKTSSVFHHLT